MSTRRVKTEAIENLKRVVDFKNDNLEAVGEMDIVMADAYDDSLKVDKHLQEINKDLETKAKEVITDNPGTGKEIKNDYTGNLKLEEDIQDFDIKSLDDLDDTEDRDFHLDYDMMDFLYACFRGLEGNANRNPNMKGFLGLDRAVRSFSPTFVDKKPMPKEGPGGTFVIRGEDTFIPYDEHAKFRVSPNGDWIINGKDTHIAVSRALEGEPQLTTNGMDKIYLSNDNIEYFNDAIEICKKLQIPFKAPQYKRSKTDYWDYTMTVSVPSVSYGYPMMLADYLETIGLTVDDVMTKEFTKTYYSKLEKIRKEQLAVENDMKVSKMIDKAIMVAMNDDEPIENHLDQLFKDLRKAKLKFNKAEVTQRFMDEF